MAKKIKKFTRKEIKEDKFITLVNKIIHIIAIYAKKYKKYFLWSFGILAGIVIISISLKIYFNNVEAKNYVLIKESDEYFNQEITQEPQTDPKKIVFKTSNEKYSKALETYEKVYKKCIGYTKKNVLLQMAHCNFYLKNYDKALNLYKKCLKKFPNNSINIFLNIAKCYEAKKDYKEAIKIYKKLEQEKDLPIKGYIYLYLAQCYKQLKDYNEAIKLYKKIEETEAYVSLKDEAKKLREWIEIKGK